MKMQRRETNQSRRKFLRNAAAGAGGLAIGLTACSPTTEDVSSTATDQTTINTTPAATPGSCKYSFETAPDPIPDSSITETVDTEVVVVGAGTAGFSAAVAAAEAGAKVILLEKYDHAAGPGDFFGAINTNELIDSGQQTDVMEITKNLVTFSTGRADQLLIRTWAENSGTAMDWLIGIAEKTNYKATLLPGLNAYVFNEADADPNSSPMGTGRYFYAMMESYCSSLGVEIRYSTAGVQLIRPNNNGSVTGIIAKKADGSYAKFNAAKAVILATGDYGSNQEMLEKYAIWTTMPLINLYVNGMNTGDGLAMALWIGAKIQDTPHSSMVHFNTNGKGTYSKPISSKLYVNKLGARYCNESAGTAEVATATCRQPGATRWGIGDSKPEYTSGGSFGGGTPDPEALSKAIEEGIVLKADTIEDLAAQIGADPTTLKATVDRYNELIASGIDSDFGGTLGLAIDTAPYYAQEEPPNRLANMGGPIVNTNMQVLDINHQVIPGLYSVGNCAGGWWGPDYPTEIRFGIAHSVCNASGYLAGLHAASL